MLLTPTLDAPYWRGNWADKPAASAIPAGAFILVNDLGYSKWFSDGTNYYPQGGRYVLGMQGPLYSMGATPGTTEMIAWQATIPAGMIVVNKAVLRYMQSVEKLGGTSDTLTTRTRLGSAGTTADASIGLGVNMATTAITAGILNQAVFPSSTGVRRSAGGANSSAVGWTATSTGARSIATTIPNVSGALIFSVTGQMTSGASETGEFDGGVLELMMKP